MNARPRVMNKIPLFVGLVVLANYTAQAEATIYEADMTCNSPALCEAFSPPYDAPLTVRIEVDLGQWKFPRCFEIYPESYICGGVYAAEPLVDDPTLTLTGWEDLPPWVYSDPELEGAYSGPVFDWAPCYIDDDYRGQRDVHGLHLRYYHGSSEEGLTLFMYCDGTWNMLLDNDTDYEPEVAGTYSMREIGDALPLDFVLITDSTGGSNVVVKGYVPGPTNIVPSSLALEGVPAQRTWTRDENGDGANDVRADWQGHGLPTPQEGENTWTLTAMDNVGQSYETQITVTCRGPTCD